MRSGKVYVPYGPEWEAEVLRLTKPRMVDLWRLVCLERDGLREKLDERDGEAARLRGIVRRFVGLVEALPPIVSAMALVDAEEPEKRNEAKSGADCEALLDKGHKSLGALMVAAHEALAEGEAEEPAELENAAARDTEADDEE